MRKITFFCLIFFLSALSVKAQGTLADYERANTLGRLYATKVYYSNVRPVWIEDTPCFWYIQTTPDSKNFILVNAATEKKSAVFNQQELAKQLSSQTGKTIDAKDLPINFITIDKNLKTVNFDYEGTNWSFTTGNKPVLKKEDKTERRPRWGSGRYWGEKIKNDKLERAVISPDKKYEAFLKNNNLYIRQLDNKEEIQLSFDGSPGDFYSTDIVWSPDSRKIAIMKIRWVDQRKIYYIEAAPDDQLQPKLHERGYTKPGDALPYQYPHIFDIAEQKQIKPNDELFKDAYENTRLKWDSDSKAITFEHNQRGHQAYRVLEVNAATGNVRPVVDEYQKTFVNYGRYFRHDLEDGKRLIWMSERDNWNHLYMYDRETGKVLQQITKGEWYVRNVISVDEEKQQILFMANGMRAHENEDPYFTRYYRINFDGTGLVSLTPEEGTHNAVFSPDKKYFVDTYSQVNVAPVVVLKETQTGRFLLPIETADISELKKAGWVEPIPFSAKGRDGKTDIWGVIIRPSNFDANKKYPVLEYIYAGPGSHYAPKAFTPSNYFLNNTAEIGFVTVQLDGMGTSFRSKEFEDVICKNLKDAGFEDRILWIKAAAEKYPWMDADKVGLYGGSAGGQNAMGGVLFHPEFYKAAYAGCGCHDNRMDKIWWNEQWMGYPIGQQYSESSNVDNAWRLTRPLMLMVGEVDDNVDPASTMQVVKALQKAGKEFELVVVPSTNHTLGGIYGDRKRYDFFVKHLLGVNPPDWNVVEYPANSR